VIARDTDAPDLDVRRLARMAEADNWMHAPRPVARSWRAWVRQTRRNCAFLAAAVVVAAVITELAVRVLLNERVLLALGIGP